MENILVKIRCSHDQRIYNINNENHITLMNIKQKRDKKDQSKTGHDLRQSETV